MSITGCSIFDWNRRLCIDEHQLSGRGVHMAEDHRVGDPSVLLAKSSAMAMAITSRWRG